MEIKVEKLKDLNEKFSEDRANRVAQNAAMSNGIESAATNLNINEEQRHNFNINLNQVGVTNQKKSGRCWMFSALNMMRFEVVKNLNLKEFEFSVVYPLFFDKLEKSNYFLNSILKTLDEETEGRLVSHILKDPIGDGGQWDMFVGLVNKYGLVPKEAMGENENSSNTGKLNNYLTKLLRGYASKLRRAHSEGKTIKELESMVDDYMSEVHRVLCISLGTPPEKFDFEIRDADGKYISEKNITPLKFFEKYVNINLDNYISIINAPTKDKPYDNTYTVDFLGSVIEGKEIKYINLPIDDLKKAAISQLKDNHPVWFGCDVGQFFNRKGSVLDFESVKVDDLFNVSFDMTKEERLDYGESLMTHAMVFMGVELDDNGAPVRWRVENSWGKDSGKDGYLVMSDRWFDEYMYQVVIDKKYLSQKILSNWEKEPIRLKPWDPMGSLA
ncbi:aminopeptidase C. Cysteine peptidase. MEROPS family C01B [Anaerosphaera aminiphila DSM 21120]|uniref:Aminopeptidase n=1 Tax=Anaerosphaera aminiphila DSM 21120 TaxID=1120995 RepID=A0A1M5QA53_9FIRM|nr:C1 family peptidase [Anaerosphaera aminiphila]SHH10912.1 aminopeptidase C. Cysteine peptidase. MEROPS family C01B [Anaerosphaera aminiphila DSM 21120]